GGKYLTSYSQAQLAVLAALFISGGTANIDLYGYSMGGVAAVDIANNFNTSGQIIDKLVLIDPVKILPGELQLNVLVGSATSFYQREALDTWRMLFGGSYNIMHGDLLVSTQGQSVWNVQIRGVQHIYM